MDSESLGETSTGRSPSNASEILGTTSGQDGTVFRTSTGRHWSLRKIKESNEAVYKSMELQLDPLVGRYVRSVLRQNIAPTRRYLSDVIIVHGPEERRRVRGWLASNGSTFPGGLFLWVDEGNHFHVVHDCPYSNGQCRCRWRKEALIHRLIRRTLRKPKFISELRDYDWYNIFLYFCLSKWESRQEVWIGRILQRVPSSDEGLQWGRMCQEQERMVQGQGEGIGYHDQWDGPHHEESGSSVHGQLQHAKKTGSKFESFSETIRTLLQKLNSIPLTDVRNIIPRSHPLYNVEFHNPLNEKYFQSACKLYQLEVNRYNLIDFYHLYNQGEPVFYANNLNPFVYYHTREESTEYLIRLLKFQYQDNTDRICALLNNIRTWFNRIGWSQQQHNGEWIINPKINSVAINGPPNSGKNYFWDTIAAIAMNVGHIGRVSNKTNQFSLQETYNRRLVIGNELNMEDSAKDDFKKLCEGSAFNIRVKYQGDQIFTRTPVVFITNGVLEISYDHAFKDIRLVTIQWQSCPLLAESKKKPYPLALFDVFNHFNVPLE